MKDTNKKNPKNVRNYNYDQLLALKLKAESDASLDRQARMDAYELAESRASEILKLRKQIKYLQSNAISSDRMLYVNYQEQIILNDGSKIKVCDVNMKIEELYKHYTDPNIAEYLLNTMGSWTDNGVCCVTEKPLEQRITKVISEDNISFHKVDVVPNDITLMEMVENK